MGKVLKIGGIDVHKELNRFLVAWIHNKGANELAQGIVDFFDDFGEKDIQAGEQTTHSAHVQDAIGQDAREPDMLKIFRDALNSDSSGASRVEPLPAACVSESVSMAMVTGFERAIGSMLLKSGPGMQMGLQA